MIWNILQNKITKMNSNTGWAKKHFIAISLSTVGKF